MKSSTGNDILPNQFLHAAKQSELEIDIEIAKEYRFAMVLRGEELNGAIADTDLYDEDIAAIDGISTVSLQFVRPYEISIEVSEENLRRYGLTLDQVSRVIRNTSLDMPGGTYGPARLHGVGVINLNDIANALKPVFLPGEHVEVRLVKTGEEPGQGVGYLEDGTMVVVEAGRDHVHEMVTIAVTSVLQTSAGRMVFGRFEGVAGKS